MKKGKFTIIETESGFHFTLTARNGKIVGTSQVYDAKQGAEVGIKSVRANAQVDKFHLFKSNKAVGNRKHWFVQKAGNGETILTGQMYSSKQKAQQGVVSVITHAQSEIIFQPLNAA